ncbi:putative ribonuclease H-like domain-containing protein [Tanacetum coccineum]
MVPRAVLMKSGLISVNTARQNTSKTAVLVNAARQVNTAHSKTTVNVARPMSYLSKIAHSTVKRLIHKNKAFINSNINQRVNIVRDKNVNTTRPKAVVNVVKGNNVNAADPRAMASATCEIMWILKVLKDLGLDGLVPVTLFCDIKSAIQIDANPVMHEKTKHFDIDVHLVREKVASGLIKTEKVDFKSQVTYILTKALGSAQHVVLIKKLGLGFIENISCSIELKNIVPKRGLTCLFAKATSDESKLWHRRLGNLNFKTVNKLLNGNLVRGLPSKLFENDQTCVACQKGKQHRAFCKSKTENSISLPLHLLHMDLFGPTFVKSLMKKMYCLVVTDDYSRFTWVFFLATKDKTSGILKSFIIGIENLVDHKVKVIRCDNGTEFKNKEMNQFCEMKGILRQFSVARTPKQNGVAERRNRTLIEAARTMLADSKLPTTFWAEVVNTACYVQKVVGNLESLYHLRKFDGKADEGFFVGYSLNSRVFNSRIRIVEENLHISLMVLQTADPPYSQDPKSSHDDGSKPLSDDGKKVDEDPRKESECKCRSY